MRWIYKMEKQNFISLAKKALQEKHHELQIEVYKNKEKVLKDEEYAKLEHRKRELIFDIPKASSQNKDTSKIQKEYENIIQKQGQLLKKHGLTFEDLKEKYNCEECKDTGYDKNDKMCSCLKAEVSSVLLKNSNICQEHLPSFSDVDYTLYSKDYVANIKGIYNRLEDYAKN